MVYAMQPARNVTGRNPMRDRQGPAEVVEPTQRITDVGAEEETRCR